MTRTTTLGVLALALVLVTSGAAGFAGATPASTADEATAATSSAPLAQDTTEENETDGNATEEGTETNETEMGETNETSEEPEVDPNASASITFDDQPSNGSAVVVNETNLSAGGFVVVLNESSAVIGNSSYLESGTHENVTVELDPELSETVIVVAEPHLDTNENRTFDYNATHAGEIGPMNATDGPYVENGVPVGSTAQITVGNETTNRSMAVPMVDP